MFTVRSKADCTIDSAALCVSEIGGGYTFARSRYPFVRSRYHFGTKCIFLFVLIMELSFFITRFITHSLISSHCLLNWYKIVFENSYLP